MVVVWYMRVIGVEMYVTGEGSRFQGSSRRQLVYPCLMRIMEGLFRQAGKL